MQRNFCRLNHCVRSANDLPRRGAMDQGRLRRFRSQLVSRAGGSRETSRQTIHRDTRSTTPKRQMDNIMYLYEQPGPPNMRRSHGGGGGWRSWWFELGSFGSALYYTSRAKRASSPWRGGTSNATLRGEGLRRPLLAASLRVGGLRGSSAEGFPIRSQNNKARQSASDARAFKDCASAISLAPTKS